MALSLQYSVIVKIIFIHTIAIENTIAIFSTIIDFVDTGMYVFVCNHAGILKSTCYIDVRWFPFDIQKCDLKFGSWTHNGWLLDLQMQAVDISSYIPNGEWDLVGESPWHYY